MEEEKPINKNVIQENAQELAQLKQEKNIWKKVEKEKVSEKELQQKNIREFNNLKWFIGEWFSYKDTKEWLDISVKVFPAFNAIVIDKGKLKFKNTDYKGYSSLGISRLQLHKDGTFYVNVTQFEQWAFAGIDQKKDLRLTPSEVSDYLKAIRNRVNHYKKTVKNKFIELSVNEDKKDADNLIENIEEQTA